MPVLPVLPIVKPNNYVWRTMSAWYDCMDRRRVSKVALTQGEKEPLPAEPITLVYSLLITKTPQLSPLVHVCLPLHCEY